MKTGTYRVYFDVTLTDCADEDEAKQEIIRGFNEMVDDDLLPEMEFELTEEFDLEYQDQEDDVKELSF